MMINASKNDLNINFKLIEKYKYNKSGKQTFVKYINISLIIFYFSNSNNFDHIH
mgnify:CR=1 FL=1